MLVPFEVRPLTRARVIWLNERWFASRGQLISDFVCRERIEQWVLDEFAVSTGVSPGKRENKRTVYADRYGDPRGTSPHGGGGRVANIGRFQVKGVGPTPLVGHATWVHSHGHASLTEAVAEAIYSELLDQELPFGATPVIAVIDAGEDGRGLIVRPAVFRPAHLLRAPLFVPAPDAALMPSRDATRTREAISYLAEIDHETRTRLRIPSDLSELTARFVTQAACCEALRIFTGGLFAQNVSMDGAVLDFGVARTLYTWSHLQLHAHARGFGGDLNRIINTADSILYFAQKAGCGNASWFARVASGDNCHSSMKSERRRIFGKFWADELLPPDIRERVRDETEEYFRQQQRLTLRERWDGIRPKVDWIHDSLSSESKPSLTTPEGTCAVRIHAAIRDASCGPRMLRHTWRSANRLLKPRPELDRARLERRIGRILRDRVDASRVERFIDGTIARCRRWWADLPVEFAVVTQRIRAGNAALQVLDFSTADTLWWLEGTRCDDRLVWGNATLNGEEVRMLQPALHGTRWSARCTDGTLPHSIATQLNSKPAAAYGEPPAWWE